MNNKKGLSDVVSNVLIILIVVAAVAILGLIVVNLVRNAGGGVENQAICQTIDVSVQSCVQSTGGATASVIRGSGDASIVIDTVTLNFVKSDGTSQGATATPGDGDLAIGEVTSGSISGLTGGITADKVIPTISGTNADGEEITCALTQREASCN